MSQLQYHYHLARDHAREAADMLREVEKSLHAVVALFELSRTEDEGLRHIEDLLAKTRALQEHVTTAWCDASEIAR